jgi:S1-C subfamily serine protease
MPTSSAFVDLSAACAEAAQLAETAVVQVQGRPRRPASGLVVAPERVVTSSHSVEWEDDHLKVRAADGRLLVAEVAGRDSRSDVVLLRVPGLDAQPLATSDTAPATGSLALAIGRTWSGQLRARIVTITHLKGPVRLGHGINFDNLLSLDVGPYPGFSGSSIVLPDARVAGMATTGLVRSVSLALPAAEIRRVADALERHGHIRHGFLGITSQPVTIPDRQRGTLQSQAGLLVVGVATGSPADQSGLLVGDILVRFDGQDVADPETLLALLTGDRIGQVVTLGVVRGDAAVDVSARVGERSSE